MSQSFEHDMETALKQQEDIAPRENPPTGSADGAIFCLLVT